MTSDTQTNDNPATYEWLPGGRKLNRRVEITYRPTR
jgi:outer membrane protein OmpA-like peptidoglycan-associated protein